MFPTPIKQAIVTALAELQISATVEQINLEHPANEEHGDYSANVAMALFAKHKQLETLQGCNNPRQFADLLVEKMQQNQDLSNIVSEISVAGPGFINFTLKTSKLVSTIEHISQTQNAYGNNNHFQNKKIMVEFAHPNTHKEMHIGHMRTLITGESISRILQAAGANVFRANYQGDIGPHVAKAIHGTQQILEEQGTSWEQSENLSLPEKAHLLGRGYVHANQSASEEDKTQIEELNTKLYQNDESVSHRYQQTRQWSLDYYDIFYQRFGTTFDKLYFESNVADAGKKIVSDNIDTVFQQSEGAVIFPGEAQGLHNRVFITAKGNPTYEAKDIGLAFTQFEDFAFDTCIHVVANEQAGYFKVIFKALEQIDPDLANREFHLSMGMVNLIGRKMSSRTGDIITVDSLLDEIKQLLKPAIKNETLTTEEVSHIAEIGTMAAIKYSVLKVKPTMNVAFDPQQSVSIHGNSGPYLQYTHARCRSILDKSQLENSSEQNNYKISDIELSVLRQLSRFPETCILAANEYAPSYICTYLFELAQRYNTFYSQHQIIKAEDIEAKRFRLQLTTAVAQVLKNGLYLLGIEAPEKM